MKKLLTLVVAAVFVGMTAGLVAAQTPQTSQAEKKAAPSVVEKKMPEKRVVARSATGNVKSASVDMVVVAGKDKGKEVEWTFGIDAKTKIRKGSKDMAAADLKAGDPVSVRYMEHDGKAMAETINVRGATAAKKTEAKPAEKK